MSANQMYHQLHRLSMTPAEKEKLRISKKRTAERYRAKHADAFRMYDQLMRLVHADTAVEKRRARHYKEKFGDFAEVAELNYKLKKEIRNGKTKERSTNIRQSSRATMGLSTEGKDRQDQDRCGQQCIQRIERDL